MSWGVPRIHSELLKLGIQISESSISKYMIRHPKPPSQTWRTFLKNQSNQLVSIDFFTVPTALFQVLFIFIVIQHDRRRLVHFNVTAHPTAEWTARQILEAFPFETAPKYLLRDRDRFTRLLRFPKSVVCITDPNGALPNTTSATVRSPECAVGLCARTGCVRHTCLETGEP